MNHIISTIVEAVTLALMLQGVLAASRIVTPASFTKIYVAGDNITSYSTEGGRSIIQCSDLCEKDGNQCDSFRFDRKSCHFYSAVDPARLALTQSEEKPDAFYKRYYDVSDLARRSGCSVSMSSPPQNGNLYGSYAIDGIHADDGSIAMTAMQVSPWIQIDLGISRVVRGVKIWNRSLAHPDHRQRVMDRLVNVLIVMISDTDSGVDTDNTRCSYSAGTQPAVRYHPCTRAMRGQFVRITSVNAEDHLNLYEIEVHGNLFSLQ